MPERALKIAREALERVGIPSPESRLRSYPHQFSGGMRQRVAIAIALLNKPKLIIADEPTTALDVTIQAQILYEAQKLCRESGTALIWITHDLSVVAGLADRICVMYAGRIVEQGSVDEVLDAPLHPYTHGLIGSVPSRNRRGSPLAQIPGMTPALLDLPPGCAFRSRCPRAAPACTEYPELTTAQQPAGALLLPLAPMKALLELEHVSKRFVQPLDLAGKIARALGADVSDEVVHAVDDVSFSVNEGEVVGLVGESGCGKSTLGRMVAGILPPSAGAIRYRGQERIGLQVQMIFQDPFASLNPRMRVEDIVGEAPVVHGLVKKEALDDYLDQLFARCGLDPSYKKRFPHQFSGGQRSRIGIARALAVKPEFLVCDEAVAALDVSIQAQILNLFMKLREDLALTYLFISHDLGVVEHLSDRVVIMYLGRVVESAARR